MSQTAVLEAVEAARFCWAGCCHGGHPEEPKKQKLVRTSRMPLHLSDRQIQFLMIIMATH